MAFATWDTLFNVLVLVFWYRLWVGDARAESFNPYLTTLSRVGEMVNRFLKPAFFMLGDRGIAILAGVLLLALRAFAAPRSDSGWVIHLGFIWRQPVETSLGSFFVFTMASFAVFIFRLWSLSLLFLRADTTERAEHTLSTLYALSRPLGRIPYRWRPLALLALGMLVTTVIELAGSPTALITLFGEIPQLPAGAALSANLLSRAFVATISGWVSVLSLLVQLMIMLIIGSWIAMFAGSQSVSMFCREWTDMLLGPMRRYPIRIGMFDLSPIVYILLVGAIHTFLQGVLLQSYLRLLGAA